MGCHSIIERTKKLEVPTEGDKLVNLICGIINIIPGVGMIILGIIHSNFDDFIIGVLQFVIPVIGWIWGLLWAILIITRNL